MRWPDIFFKPRKSKPFPEIVTVPPKAAAEPAERRPETTEADRAEAARAEKEKTESLRALADSGSVKLTPRAEKESPLAIEKPVETDASNAKTTALPSLLPRASGVSLRQRAKLTDDARSLPKDDVSFSPSSEPSKPTDETAKPAEPAKVAEPTETKASEPGKVEGSAVVPAAFTVPVETGSVLDKPPEKSEDKPASQPIEAEAAKPAESQASAAKPTDETSPNRPEPPETSGSSRDTLRVHLGSATTSNEPSKEIEPAKADTREKTEFVLSNGERIYGHVLSETPQTIYLDHGTLGVLTLPRSQIATKPIEVILINGDRVVGDLIAETPECLYIKHASLGMLTVPHGQRSTRVVEAILKDGDRILGEVLAETDNFTVIRSATLGTVAVQHEQVAMLNRKIEQMQLRALPPAEKPSLENKKD
jgi:RNase P/RNase MRP subunit p29